MCAISMLRPRRFIDTIIHDEEMISRWDVLMAEVECDEGDMMLKMFVELYVIVINQALGL